MDPVVTSNGAIRQHEGLRRRRPSEGDKHGKTGPNSDGAIMLRSIDGSGFGVSMDTARRIPVIRSALFHEPDAEIIPFLSKSATRDNVDFMLQLLAAVRLIFRPDRLMAMPDPT